MFLCPSKFVGLSLRRSISCYSIPVPPPVLPLLQKLAGPTATVPTYRARSVQFYSREYRTPAVPVLVASAS